MSPAHPPYPEHAYHHAPQPMSPPSPRQDARDSPFPPGKKAPALLGLNPLGLMEGVLGGQATDWEPPLAEELEPCFPGYTGFCFIDRGGMGAVYSATQTSLDRRVAVKILPPDLGRDALFVDSFHREARLLARLQHPHIVAVYDFGRNAAGYLFIVMEYVDGTSLLNVMKKERLPLPRALQIIAQVCEALQFAHEHGVIHRDIKPTNILIDSRGSVRVADFGLARLIQADTTTTQTRGPLIMGTPVYAAPEQRRLSPGVDHRMDIFSVGVTLYEMITGHFPVGVFEPPSKKAGSPPALDKIVTKALRESPADRYQSAVELRQAVLRASDRLTQPVIQRTIAQRPMISMMTTVIVTASLIYLFDEVNTQVLQKMHPVRAPLPVQSSPQVPLNDTFSLLNTRMTWYQAQIQAAALPDAELASIQSTAELTELNALLEEHGIRSGVWTGGIQKEPEGTYEWTDHTPWKYEAWMPAAINPPLVVTEVQPKNNGTLHTRRGDTPDWIEVHNPSSKPVDLTGWRLTHYQGREFFEDRLGGGMMSGTPDLTLAPGEYRVIFCSAISEDEDETPQIHFRLEARHGRIAWADPRGNVVQSFNSAWSNFPANASISSDPTGRNWGVSPRPTPGQPNPPPLRPLAINVTPRTHERLAVMLLPQFNSRWSATPLDRKALPLIRHKTR